MKDRTTELMDVECEIAGVSPAEVAKRARELTKQGWAAIQEAHAEVALTEHQRRDWAALQDEMIAREETWDAYDQAFGKGTQPSAAELHQLMWQSIRLTARFQALSGIADLIPRMWMTTPSSWWSSLTKTRRAPNRRPAQSTERTPAAHSGAWPRLTKVLKVERPGPPVICEVSAQSRSSAP